MSLFYPVEQFSHWLTYSVFQINPGSFLGETIHFFLADVIKILILLLVITFSISLIRSFLPQEKIHKILSGKKGYVSYFLAGLFGIVTPFCSCSAIPLFLGFLEAGIPLGITFSFLVASPMINEVALVLLLGLFGLKIAMIYVISGLLVAVFSGIFIDQLKVETLVEDYLHEQRKRTIESRKMGWKERVSKAGRYTWMVFQRVYFFVLLGVGIGAWIHGYVPMDFLAQVASADKWYAVPLATIIGIPLYSNAAGIIPLVSALTEKGMAVGTALAFMMAVTGLSFPEFIILKKVMKTKLIAIFASVVGVGIIIVGYLFNWILG